MSEGNNASKEKIVLDVMGMRTLRRAKRLVTLLELNAPEALILNEFAQISALLFERRLRNSSFGSRETTALLSALEKRKASQGKKS